MKKFIEWFSTPYYFNPSIIYKFKTSIIIGLFVFLFLYVFKPFALVEFKEYLLEFTAIIGLFAFIGALLILVISPVLFPNFFNEDKWTLGKNMILIVLGLGIVGSVLWVFTYYYKENIGLPKISYITFLYYTFLVGAIPIFFAIYLNERNIRIKKRKRALEFSKHKQKKLLVKEKIIKTDIIIYSENKKENISFNVNNLVYISSQGNYASFYILNDNGNLKEKILRVTLTKIEKELDDFVKIIRCHKSYIVNMKYITDINGNARGYLLKSEFISFEIPVSRSFSKQSIMSFLD